jgi:hypothetical protein
MSDESEVDKILAKARQLKDAFGTTIGAGILVLALWLNRKRPGVIQVIISRVAVLLGIASYGYWQGY